MTEVAIVIPTVGRPSLTELLKSLAASARHTGRALPPIVAVDDRRPGDRGDGDLVTDLPGALPAVTVLESHGRGPAAARNVGWRACDAEWIAFLDDDVLVGQDWLEELARDLRQCRPSVAGCQGRISVPLPDGRRPTDWERGTAGLQTARWITADMAYRRSVLVEVGGFDERFPRAFREDADLALRVLDRGHTLGRGGRQTTHPVRPAGWWASVRQQRGNADDVLMARRHGPDWRLRARAPLGRRPQHAVTTSAAVIALTAALARRPRMAAAAAGAWALMTAEFSWRRIAPGPRDLPELAKMAVTSVAIPPAACLWFLDGLRRHRRVPRSGRETGTAPATASYPAAVLLDRDGTLVVDVPYNGDPSKVTPMPGAQAALQRLRRAGIPLAVITNQSGIGRGLLSADQVSAVNRRIEELLGPFQAWLICPHTDQDRCECRKPAPGLVHRAARQLGVRPGSCVVIGDIGSDMSAAAAAGAAAIMVPTELTRDEEVRAAPRRASTLGDAVDLVLAGR